MRDAAPTTSRSFAPHLGWQSKALDSAFCLGRLMPRACAAVRFVPNPEGTQDGSFTAKLISLIEAWRLCLRLLTVD
jgi:hypothetical protein